MEESILSEKIIYCIDFQHRGRLVLPPGLVLFEIAASCMPLLRGAKRFGVSILGGSHQAVADRFAGRDGSTGAARFADAAWTAEPGRPPVLTSALASFECALDEIIERYSHAIIIRAWSEKVDRLFR